MCAGGREDPTDRDLRLFRTLSETSAVRESIALSERVWMEVLTRYLSFLDKDHALEKKNKNNSV